MGSEQSSQGQGASHPLQHQKQHSFNQQSSSFRLSANIKRQHTIANPGSQQDDGNGGERPGSTSPGPSVCSDSDLPYISYTVNRPIGDSPKITSKPAKLKSSSAGTQRKAPGANQRNVKKATPAHNIVVVKPAIGGPNVDKDPEILRLQNIPMFLPIMRGTLNLPAARDPEVLERLDPAPCHKLCVLYQKHLTTCANLVATEQNNLTQKVRETDAEIGRLFLAATERQKRYAKYAEKLSKVQELSHSLNRCHMLLNQILESMETLNNCLDIEDRLEPFVWTTG